MRRNVAHGCAGYEAEDAIVKVHPWTLAFGPPVAGCPKSLQTILWIVAGLREAAPAARASVRGEADAVAQAVNMPARRRAGAPPPTRPGF